MSRERERERERERKRGSICWEREYLLGEGVCIYLRVRLTLASRDQPLIIQPHVDFDFNFTSSRPRPLTIFTTASQSQAVPSCSTRWSWSDPWNDPVNLPHSDSSFSRLVSRRSLFRSSGVHFYNIIFQYGVQPSQELLSETVACSLTPNTARSSPVLFIFFYPGRDACSPL